MTPKDEQLVQEIERGHAYDLARAETGTYALTKCAQDVGHLLRLLSQSRENEARYLWLRSRSTYRYDCGQFVLNFDNWIVVPDVDEFGDDEWRPTPPDSFDSAIDAAALSTSDDGAGK